MILDGTIYLGNDTDCETCGTSYNHINYALDTVKGQHTVSVNVGCYGAEATTVDGPGEAVNLLAPYRTWPGGEEVNELIRWLVG